MPVLTPAPKLSGQRVLDGYAASTANFAYSTDNNFVDITGLSITFTPLQALVYLNAHVPYLVTDTANQAPSVGLTDSANTFVHSHGGMIIAAANFVPFGVPVSLTPGVAVTYKLRVRRGLAGASGVTVAMSAIAPGFLEAIYR